MSGTTAEFAKVTVSKEVLESENALGALPDGTELPDEVLEHVHNHGDTPGATRLRNIAVLRMVDPDLVENEDGSIDVTLPEQAL